MEKRSNVLTKIIKYRFIFIILFFSKGFLVANNTSPTEYFDAGKNEVNEQLGNLPIYYQGSDLTTITDTGNELLAGLKHVGLSKNGADAAFGVESNSPELTPDAWLNHFISRNYFDALALTNFVHNEIRLTDIAKVGVPDSPDQYTFCAQSIKRSASQTFTHRSGSAIEQCALLVYFLRASGIPAGYAAATPNSVFLEADYVNLLQGKVSSQSGALVPVNFPWVVALVHTDGEDRWIHLFPWIKDVVVQTGPSLYDLIGDDYQSAIDILPEFFDADLDKIDETYATSTAYITSDSELGGPQKFLPRFLAEKLKVLDSDVTLDQIGYHFVHRKSSVTRWQDFPKPVQLLGDAQIHVRDSLSGLSRLWETVQFDLVKINEAREKTAVAYGTEVPASFIPADAAYLYQSDDLLRADMGNRSVQTIVAQVENAEQVKVSLTLTDNNPLSSSPVAGIQFATTTGKANAHFAVKAKRSAPLVDLASLLADERSNMEKNFWRLFERDYPVNHVAQTTHVLSPIGYGKHSFNWYSAGAHAASMDYLNATWRKAMQAHTEVLNNLTTDAEKEQAAEQYNDSNVFFTLHTMAKAYQLELDDFTDLNERLSGVATNRSEYWSLVGLSENPDSGDSNAYMEVVQTTSDINASDLGLSLPEQGKRVTDFQLLQGLQEYSLMSEIIGRMMPSFNNLSSPLAILQLVAKTRQQLEDARDPAAALHELIIINHQSWLRNVNGEDNALGNIELKSAIGLPAVRLRDVSVWADIKQLFTDGATELYPYRFVVLTPQYYKFYEQGDDYQGRFKLEAAAYVLHQKLGYIEAGTFGSQSDDANQIFTSYFDAPQRIYSVSHDSTSAGGLVLGPDADALFSVSDRVTLVAVETTHYANFAYWEIQNEGGSLRGVLAEDAELYEIDGVGYPSIEVDFQHAGNVNVTAVFTEDPPLAPVVTPYQGPYSLAAASPALSVIPSEDNVAIYYGELSVDQSQWTLLAGPEDVFANDIYHTPASPPSLTGDNEILAGMGTLQNGVEYGAYLKRGDLVGEVARIELGSRLLPPELTYQNSDNTIVIQLNNPAGSGYSAKYVQIPDPDTVPSISDSSWLPIAAVNPDREYEEHSVFHLQEGIQVGKYYAIMLLHESFASSVATIATKDLKRVDSVRIWSASYITVTDPGCYPGSAQIFVSQSIQGAKIEYAETTANGVKPRPDAWSVLKSNAESYQEYSTRKGIGYITWNRTKYTDCGDLKPHTWYAIKVSKTGYHDRIDYYKTYGYSMPRISIEYNHEKTARMDREKPFVKVNYWANGELGNFTWTKQETSFLNSDETRNAYIAEASGPGDMPKDWEWRELTQDKQYWFNTMGPSREEVWTDHRCDTQGCYGELKPNQGYYIKVEVSNLPDSFNVPKNSTAHYFRTEPAHNWKVPSIQLAKTNPGDAILGTDDVYVYVQSQSEHGRRDSFRDADRYITKVKSRVAKAKPNGDPPDSFNIDYVELNTQDYLADPGSSYMEFQRNYYVYTEKKSTFATRERNKRGLEDKQLYYFLFEDYWGAGQDLIMPYFVDKSK